MVKYDQIKTASIMKQNNLIKVNKSIGIEQKLAMKTCSNYYLRKWMIKINL